MTTNTRDEAAVTFTGSNNALYPEIMMIKGD